MRLAIVGTRGIPARYGGFETFAEELSTRLVRRGHEVTVYCRQRHAERTYRDVQLQCLPTIHHKYLDTIVHTLLSTLHLLVHRQQVALYCNAANAIFTILPRVTGIPVALNVDGLERKRKKWNRIGQAWYGLSERLSTVFPSEVVSDAVTIQQYYQRRYHRPTTFIPYGAETGKVATTGVIEQLGLQPGKYLLYVSRMEPENNALLVRRAFEKVDTNMKLALVGDAPYSADYIREVRDTADPRIIIPGAVYGLGYRELTSHCFAYVHATEVGGTHPALIEAMGRGALTLYLRTEENEEVAGGAGLPFRDEADLARQLQKVISGPAEQCQRLRKLAEARVAERYGWETVADAYEALLLRLANRGNL